MVMDAVLGGLDLALVAQSNQLPQPPLRLHNRAVLLQVVRLWAAHPMLRTCLAVDNLSEWRWAIPVSFLLMLCNFRLLFVLKAFTVVDCITNHGS